MRGDGCLTPYCPSSLCFTAKNTEGSNRLLQIIMASPSPLGKRHVTLGDVLHHNASSPSPAPDYNGRLGPPNAAVKAVAAQPSPMGSRHPPHRLQPLAMAPTPPPAHDVGADSSAAARSGSNNATPNPYATLARLADVVDYSFLDLTDIAEIAEMVPRRGQLWMKPTAASIAAGIHASAAAAGTLPTKGGSGALFNASGQVVNQDWEEHIRGNNGRTRVTNDGVVVMRAKDETYSFRETSSLGIQDKGDPREAKRFYLDEYGNLVERTLTLEEMSQDYVDQQYLCTSLKLDHNAILSKSFEDAFRIVLAKRFYQPARNIVHVDLSFNKLTEVPHALASTLPLKSLLFHCNKVEDMMGLRNLHLLSTTLKKFSINENPLQAKMGRRLKPTVLYCMPFLECLDDVRVTKADKEQLKVFGDFFGRSVLRFTAQAFEEAEEAKRRLAAPKVRK